MKVTLKAIATTTYQLNSLNAFNIGSKKIGNGSFIGSKVFDSADDAKQYMITRAEKYNDEDPDGSPERLAEMYDDIHHGCLTLDAVTAHIEDNEDYDQE